MYQVPIKNPITMMDMFDGAPPPSLRGNSNTGVHVITILTAGEFTTPAGTKYSDGDVLYTSGGAWSGAVRAVGWGKGALARAVACRVRGVDWLVHSLGCLKCLFATLGCSCRSRQIRWCRFNR